MSYERSLSGSLLVHIAFHYVPERASFLECLLRNFAEYRFDRTDLVVDTNSQEGADVCAGLSGDVECRIYDNLPHPFELTWAHRHHMKSKLDDYDYFLYIEDDILLLWESVVRWHENSEHLRPEGWIPGFVRVEQSPDDVWMSTDYKRQVRNPTIVSIEGRRFFVSHKPYQGFWIYSHEQMREFVASESWVDGGGPWGGRRERATAGLIFENAPRGMASRLVVPLTETYEVPEHARVHHVPNTYAKRNHGKRKKLGTVPVADLLKVGWLTRRRVHARERASE